MQPRKTLLVSALLGGVGLVCINSTALAAIAAQHGTVCKPYAGNSGLQNVVQGFKNNSTAAREVVCPLVRAGEVVGPTFGIYIDGRFPSGSGSCTMYSYTYTGTLLGTVSTGALTQTFDRYIELPASQVPAYSYQSVYCTVPAKGVIWGINPVF
jgi:hypothetical protein